MAKKKRASSSNRRWHIAVVLVAALGLIVLSRTLAPGAGEGPVIKIQIVWPVGDDAEAPYLSWLPLPSDPGFKQIGGGVLLDKEGQRIRRALGWRTSGGEKEELARMRLTSLGPDHVRLKIICAHAIRLDPATPPSAAYRIVEPPLDLPATLPPGQYLYVAERVR